MKKQLFVVSVILIIAFTGTAQTRSGFKYQAVVRDTKGTVIENSAVKLKVGLLEGTENGVSVYSEEHLGTTNAFGLISAIIGEGTNTTGSFNAIKWAENNYFMKVEIAVGTSIKLELLGISPLLPVPYALHAETVTNSSDATWSQDGTAIYYNQGNVGIGTVKPTGKLEVKGVATANPDEIIFGVLNNAGDTVFAVYQGGVRVNVQDNAVKASGSRGGFAVGGISGSKGITNEYMRVTPDSVRIYVENNPTKASGSRGGFAVGGISSGKTSGSNYMYLEPENYFIGHESGSNLTTGLYNSALGYQSGLSISTGSENALMGYQSGFSNQTGSGNLFLGYQTGYSNKFGNYNSFLGYQAGYSNTSGVYNTFLGSFSGYSNTEGNNNTFVGDSTGYSNSTGFGNTFMGTGTGNKNTSGNKNVFIGNQSGYKNTTGVQNIMIGYQSGFSNVFSYDNIFMGTSSGFNNTEGFSNVFIGTFSGYSNTTGGDNVFIGKNAGYKNTTGRENVFLGWLAGESNTTSLGNVFIGAQAGNKTTSGEANTFVGLHTGAQNKDAWNNTIMGAWTADMDSIGSGNTLYGSEVSRNLRGFGNTVVGFNAGPSLANSDRNVFIGYQAGFHETGSNRLYIDNKVSDSTNALIYGQLDNRNLRFNARIGISGNPDPNYNLTLSGSSSAGSLKLIGNGDGYNYSSIGMVSQGTAIENLWQINHSMDNHKFKLIHFDESGWYVDLELDTLGTMKLNRGGLNIGGSIIPISDNSHSLGNASNKWTAVYAQNGIIQTSDARMKEGIQTLDYGLNEVLKLNPVSFYWKNNTEGSRNIGLIAQEVQQVVNEAVKTGDDKDNTLGINYSELIPVLIKGMQEQQQLILSQQQEISSLRDKTQEIDELKAELKAIKILLDKK
jgi:hypothetical protein